MQLPVSNCTLLIRTDFSDEDAWLRARYAASHVTQEGFQAFFQIVDDPKFSDADPADLAAEAKANKHGLLLVIADLRTMSDPEMPFLCVCPRVAGGQFRVVPDHLWSAENNLSLANMDCEEFIAAVDTDGVFRGFKD